VAPGGGITNIGTISVSSAAAIEVSTNVGSFTGGISNSGKLTGAEGIFVNEVAVFGNTGGGITNSGTIAAKNSGIRVGLVNSFSGGISNASGG
jgi:hypothetical protein